MTAVLAHGVGGREDLPIPLPYALTGAVVALVVTFLVLSVAWKDSRFRGDTAGRPLPRWLARVLDSDLLRHTLRAVGIVGAAWLVVVLLTGPDTARHNPGPRVLYVVMWVILPLASLLLGPLWRAVNPVSALHGVVARVSATPPEGLVAYPPRWGYWPAAVMLAAFVWLELVLPERAEPHVVLLALAVYATVGLLGALLFGPVWFARADLFEVYSSLAARLAPVGRRRDGRLVWRNPFHGLDSLVPSPGLAAVVLVLLGSTAFDSISGSPQWIQFAQSSGSPALVGTAGLAVVVAVVAAAYVITIRSPSRLTERRRQLPASFAHSLLPIALGYVIAHYYSLAVVEGQRTVILAANRPGGGDNLLGLEPADASLALVAPTAVATVQVCAVIAGHVAGAVAAHDRAVRLFPRRLARIGQLPLLLLMVGYTYLGLTLLFAA